MVNITTIHGEMDEALLEKRTGTTDNPNDSSDWIEYWYNGELVHRSVHVSIKHGLDVFGETATFG